MKKLENEILKIITEYTKDYEISRSLLTEILDKMKNTEGDIVFELISEGGYYG